jgi:hypothetical protein
MTLNSTGNIFHFRLHNPWSLHSEKPYPLRQDYKYYDYFHDLSVPLYLAHQSALLLQCVKLIVGRLPKPFTA